MRRRKIDNLPTILARRYSCSDIAQVSEVVIITKYLTGIQVPEALVEEGLEVSAEYCVEVRHLGFLSAVVETCAISEESVSSSQLMISFACVGQLCWRPDCRRSTRVLRLRACAERISRGFRRSAGSSSSALASASSGAKLRAQATSALMARMSPLIASAVSVLIKARCFVIFFSRPFSCRVMDLRSSSARSLANVGCAFRRPLGFPLCPGLN